MNFAIRILFCSRFESFESLDVPSPFRTRFGNFNMLILCSSVRARFRVFRRFHNFFTSSQRDLKQCSLPLPREVRDFRWIDVLPLFRTRFRVLLKNDTSILFRTRFEADLWYFYPPPPEVRSWSFDLLICSLCWTHTWRPVKLGSVPVLHLKADQTWFCFGLTLESRSNL